MEPIRKPGRYWHYAECCLNCYFWGDKDKPVSKRKDDEWCLNAKNKDAVCGYGGLGCDNFKPISILVEEYWRRTGER